VNSVYYELKESIFVKNPELSLSGRKKHYSYKKWLSKNY
jgi:hypothetical protein